MGCFLMIILAMKSLHDAFHLALSSSLYSFVLPHVSPALKPLKILWFCLKDFSSFPPS